MVNAYMRRKEPAAVRRALLDSAARIAAIEGFAAVTMQAVASAAQVTKGGLMHHFPNKQALIEGMFLDVLAKFEHTIESIIAADAEPHGCFTRAYVQAIFDQKQFGAGTAWAAMSAAVTADAAMRQLWFAWLGQCLARHHRTDAGLELELVRLAADGAWYAYVCDAHQAVHAAEIRAGLLARTTPAPR